MQVLSTTPAFLLVGILIFIFKHIKQKLTFWGTGE